jgi:hypothetical protein
MSHHAAVEVSGDSRPDYVKATPIAPRTVVYRIEFVLNPHTGAETAHRVIGEVFGELNKRGQAALISQFEVEHTYEEALAILRQRSL